MDTTDSSFTSVEICAGAGGQALGLHNAGFRHRALIEIDDNACDTLEKNITDNPDWRGCEIIKADLRDFKPAQLGFGPGELDLLAGGVPCPPFSAAGKQLGPDDERDLFPVMLNLVEELQPKAVLIENVRGLLEPEDKFRDYRENVIERRLREAGYKICSWQVLEAADYGVPQLRPRAILVAMREPYHKHFPRNAPRKAKTVTMAEALAPSMLKRYKKSGCPEREWRPFFERWLGQASRGTVAPTLVGGSKKHGGADLGPTRAKAAWRKLGVDGLGVANEPEEMKDPKRDLFGDNGPKLTVSQAAIIQGFPGDWKFSGRKTAAYRQVGNAFPPPVAEAVGLQVADALKAGVRETQAAQKRGLLFDLTATSVASRAESGDLSGDLECAVGW